MYLDSLLLLFDALWKVKAQYMLLEEKQNIFCFPSKNFEASGDSLYHEIAYVPTLPFWTGGSPFERTDPVFRFLPEIYCFEKILA